MTKWNNRFTVQIKQSSIGRRHHLALSWLERRSQYLASKDRSNLRANDLKLKPIFIYHSKSPRALKNNAKSNLEQQGLDDSTFVYNIFFCLLNILSLLLRPTAQKKFQNNTVHWQCKLVTQELSWRDKIYSCLPTQHPFCSSCIKE